KFPNTTSASELQPGIYLIYNRVQNAQGQRLAMTFSGDQKPITVAPVELHNTKQRWIIENYGIDTLGGSGYRVKPEENPGLEAASDKTIFTRPIGPRGPIWSIRSNESGTM
ncbi:hypothetical protein FRC11_011113, partial [Ceratobasidium sp. 423]